MFSGCSKNKTKIQINVQQDPTEDQFFGKKPTIEEIQKLLSPSGFLSELQYKDYEGVNKNGEIEKKEEKKPTEKEWVFNKAAYLTKELNEWGMPKELGFKSKGPEPTRFGDWERKGRCTDF